MLVSRRSRARRSSARVPRHPGARPRAALPALRDRLQLPPEQRARRDRPRAARRCLTSASRQRRANFAFYREALGDLAGISFMPEAAWGRRTAGSRASRSTRRRSARSREDVRLRSSAKHRGAAGLEADASAAGVLLTAGVRGGAVSARLFETGICLPSGSSLTAREQAAVIAAVAETRAARGRPAPGPGGPSSDHSGLIGGEDHWLRADRYHAPAAGSGRVSNWLAFLLRFDWHLPSLAVAAFWQELPRWSPFVRSLVHRLLGLHGVWRYPALRLRASSPAFSRRSPRSSRCLAEAVLEHRLFPRSIFIVDWSCITWLLRRDSPEPAGRERAVRTAVAASWSSSSAPAMPAR